MNTHTLTIPHDAKLNLHAAARLVERYSVKGVDLDHQRPGQRNYNIGVCPVWDDQEPLTEQELCQELTASELAEARRALLAIIGSRALLFRKKEWDEKERLKAVRLAKGLRVHHESPQYQVNDEMVITYDARTNTIDTVMVPKEYHL